MSEKPTEHKIKISPKVFKVLEAAKKSAQERKIKYFSVEELIDHVFEKTKPEVIQEFVELKTPLAFKLELLLNNPNALKDIEKVVSKHSKSSDLNMTNDTF